MLSPARPWRLRRPWNRLSVITKNKRWQNAAAAAEALAAKGLRIVSGGTESHMFLVDLRNKNVTGHLAETALDKAHITLNKNAIPNDPLPPKITSGVRFGSSAATTRGFKEDDFRQVADFIVRVLDAPR